MIGQATKCWEEKHDERIIELNELREKLIAAEFIMALYRKKYGPLHVKRNVRDSIIKPETESLGKSGSWLHIPMFCLDEDRDLEGIWTPDPLYGYTSGRLTPHALTNVEEFSFTVLWYCKWRHV